MLINSFFSALIAVVIIFPIVYNLYRLYIKTFLQLLYYKAQGIPTIFHWESIYMFKAKRDARDKGVFFDRYKQVIKQHPHANAIAENYFSKPRLVLIDAEVMKEFLQRYDEFEKDLTNTGLMRELAAGSLLFIEGNRWKNRRKLLTGAFNFDVIKNSVPMIMDVVQGNFRKWMEEGDLKNQDLTEKLALISGEIVGRFIFGEKYQDRKIDGVPMTIAIQRLNADLMTDGYSVPNLLFGTKAAHANILPRHKKLNADVANMRKACRALVDAGAEEAEEKDTTFLKLLLSLTSTSDSDYQMTLDDITDEFLGFFLAGTDTTSHLVASTIYFLTKYPHIYERVKEEVNKEFANIKKVSIESLNKMDYTTAVIKETLRLGGPICFIFDRMVSRDTTLGGMKVKKGTAINLLIESLMTSRKYFSRPQEFLPERWLDDPAFSNDGFKKETHSFIPFSAGPRNCIGQHLAMIEAKILLALFIKTFDFSFEKDCNFTLVLRFLYEPKDPLLVTLQPKS